MHWEYRGPADPQGPQAALGVAVRRAALECQGDLELVGPRAHPDHRARLGSLVSREDLDPQEGLGPAESLVQAVVRGVLELWARLEQAALREALASQVAQAHRERPVFLERLARLEVPDHRVRLGLQVSRECLVEVVGPEQAEHLDPRVRVAPQGSLGPLEDLGLLDLLQVPEAAEGWAHLATRVALGHLEHLELMVCRAPLVFQECLEPRAIREAQVRVVRLERSAAREPQVPLGHLEVQEHREQQDCWVHPARLEHSACNCQVRQEERALLEQQAHSASLARREAAGPRVGWV